MRACKQGKEGPQTPLSRACLGPGLIRSTPANFSQSSEFPAGANNVELTLKKPKRELPSRRIPEEIWLLPRL